MKGRTSHLETGREERETEADDLPDLVFDAEVLDAARRLFPLVAEWGCKNPVVLPRRFVSMCVNSAWTCADSTIDTMFHTAILSLLVFAIDDLADGVIEAVEDEHVAGVLRLYARVASDPHGWFPLPSTLILPGAADPSQAWVQVANALGELCRDLARRATPEGYRAFAHYFADCMEAMCAEHDWRVAFHDRGEIPSFDEYMCAAERSIAAAVVCGALLSMDAHLAPGATGSVSFETVSAACDRVMMTAGRCLRLANDARSFERETEIEKKANGVLIFMRGQNMAAQQAKALLLEYRERTWQELLGLIRALPAELTDWGQKVRRFCESIQKWYSVMDFHDAPERLRRLFRVVSPEGVSDA